MKQINLILLASFLLCGCAFSQKKSLPKLTSKTFAEQVWNFKKDKKKFNYLGTKPIIVDFYADWCVPCKKVQPILVELQEEYGDRLTIYQVNIDKAADVAEAFNLDKIPALLFVKGDQTTYFLSVGLKTKEELKKIIEEVIFGE